MSRTILAACPLCLPSAGFANPARASFNSIADIRASAARVTHLQADFRAQRVAFRFFFAPYDKRTLSYDWRGKRMPGRAYLNAYGPLPPPPAAGPGDPRDPGGPPHQAGVSANG